MRKKSITFIRHAQSVNNSMDYSMASYNDMRLADPHITEIGKSQAMLLQQYFDENKEYYKFDLIASSPMVRALETANIVFCNHDTPKVVWPNVYEARGLYQFDKIYPGMKRSEFINNFPGFSIPAAITENGWHFPQKIETIPESFDRARQIIRQIMTDSHYERIAIITHRKLLIYLLTIFLKQYIIKNLSAVCSFQVSNTGIINISYNKSAFSIRDLNLIPHLEKHPELETF